MRLLQDALRSGSRPDFISNTARRRPFDGTRSAAAVLNAHSTVLAVIPHFNGHRWLDQCLESLARQTRPPDAIVVVDDDSSPPPADIVSRFDRVTLVRASRNVGPYRLLQQIVDDTSYDAYMLQDADDWSAADRLALLLEAAEVSAAEVVGCQELRVIDADSRLLPVSYPLDANAALLANPGAYPVLHSSSLLSRRLIRRIGGFATGLRYSGDSEFLRRAAHVARVVNIPHFAYFRRDHPQSLTNAPETGWQSPGRRSIGRLLQDRAARNAAAVRENRLPDVTPIATAPPIHLERVLGPPLSTSSSAGR
jgi:glycosyltransferase involved in cell wall biosynthesis